MYTNDDDKEWAHAFDTCFIYRQMSEKFRYRDDMDHARFHAVAG